jgi:tyrosine-protein kinase Etk/Wzc
MAIDTRIPPVEQETEIPISPPPQLPRQEDEISLLDLLITLASRKWMIVKITAVFGIVALLISLVLPKRYTAEAIVLPPQQNSSFASTLASQLGGGLTSLAALAGGAGQSLLKNPNDMYVAMFKSQTVEDGVIQQFGLMREYKKKYLSDARKELESNFKVNGTNKDGLLHISVEDKDPKRAAELANGWIDQFRKLSESLAITEASQRRVFFEGQMEQAKNNLANAEEALKKTEQTTGMMQVDAQASALIQSAAILRAQIVAKQVQLEALRSYATNQNSNVVELQQEIDSLQAQLAKLGGSGDVSAAGLILPRGKVPEAGLEYVRKMRDVKYYETIFDIMARQYELAKVDEAKEGAVIQVVDPALVPDRKSFPHRGLITIVATLLGFIVGITFALVQPSLARLRQDPETEEKLSFLRKSMRLKSSRVS